MFELDHDLAQDIVDRAMAILPYNVNVMDNQGLILGSGERERINTRHEGAQLVLANGRVVEIDEHTAVHLKGVQPGINRWMVGHGTPFRAVAGPPHLAEGEAVVLRPDGESWVVLARLAVADWAALR